MGISCATTVPDISRDVFLNNSDFHNVLKKALSIIINNDPSLHIGGKGISEIKV